MCHRKTQRLSNGFTLVELLVVIGVIGILCGLLLPAIVAARESARVVHCQNNMRQLAIGVMESESTFKRYPSSGWGWRWVADPDRGFGANQPGSWIYQILPYIEEQNAQNVGRGSTSTVKRLELALLTERSLSIVRCPSRGSADLCPIDPNISWRNAELSTGFARTDYVGNGGSTFRRC